MRATIKKTIDKNEMPDSLVECLNKINEDTDAKEFVNSFETEFCLEDKFKQIRFSLKEFDLEVENLKVWAMMKLFYDFEVTYDFERKSFEIGGYETQKLTSKTLSGLLRKIEKEFDKTWKDKK